MSVSFLKYEISVEVYMGEGIVLFIIVFLGIMFVQIYRNIDQGFFSNRKFLLGYKYKLLMFQGGVMKLYGNMFSDFCGKMV